MANILVVLKVKAKSTDLEQICRKGFTKNYAERVKKQQQMICLTHLVLIFVVCLTIYVNVC